MSLPTNHDERMRRARIALEGLSVGDAFGERFFTNPAMVESLIASRALPAAPWRYTDDTEMALAIVSVLEAKGRVDEDALAIAFAHRYARNPERGYGGGAHQILGNIARGAPWAQAAGEAFDGEGSMGNGGAMRVAPLGAYFEDDLAVVVEQASASARVTHAHPDGQAGAVAVAVAAAVAWRMGQGSEARSGEALLEAARAYTPEGPTRAGIGEAIEIPLDREPREVARLLGSGSRVLSWDTVPFSLWCAARHIDNYEEAMWATVSGLGDRDTTCAIVGGIVVLSAGEASIPRAFIEAREALAS